VLLNDYGYLMPNLDDNAIEKEEMIKLGIRIRTQDLIYWSFQITSGMNHLSNKKVNYDSFLKNSNKYWK